MAKSKYILCRMCGIEQRIDWTIKNSIWKKVLNKVNFYPNLKYRLQTSMCLECFLGLAEKADMKITKNDFLFLGFRTGAIFIDKKE